MKSILVPVEITEAMRPALETALLLAKHREAYIEGFPLRFGISEFATAEVVGGFPSDVYNQYGAQEAEQTHVFTERLVVIGVHFSTIRHFPAGPHTQPASRRGATGLSLCGCGERRAVRTLFDQPGSAGDRLYRES